MEHALSEELEARIDEQLGYPTHDPHGDPIPNAELELTEPEVRPLSELRAGERATVRRVPDGDSDLLRTSRVSTSSRGARRAPQRSAVRRTGHDPFGRDEHAISRELAGLIGVG